jgi:aspartyl protease family protein
MFQKLALFATIAGGVGIGLLWPTPQKTTAAAPGTGASDVVIAQSADRHYYADASVNGRPVHFMIDTGASETALTEDDAQSVGIAVDPNKYQVIGDGASGMVRGQYVELKSIDLGGISQRDTKAVVVQGSSVSLLGQPFLENVEEIVIRKGEMRLKAGADS